MPYRKSGVGYRHNEASLFAALEIEETVNEKEAMVLEVVKDRGPITVDEVTRILGMSPFSVRPRMTGLKKKGLIKNSGTRRLGDSGKPQTCWEAT